MLSSLTIDNWLGQNAPTEIFDCLYDLDERPLSLPQFNQLLALSHEAPVTPGFFRYYWLSAPLHPHNVTKIPRYNPAWVTLTQIASLDQLYWSLYRFYVDALLFCRHLNHPSCTSRTRPAEGSVRGRTIDVPAGS